MHERGVTQIPHDSKATLPCGDALVFEGVRCSCGSERLTIFAPCDAGEEIELLGTILALRKPVPMRGWCSLVCAMPTLSERQAVQPACVACGSFGPLTAADGNGRRYCDLACAGMAAS